VNLPTLLAYRYYPLRNRTELIYQWGIPGINMPMPRQGAAVALRELSNSLVLFGGRIKTPGQKPVYKNDTWSLNLNTGLWTKLDSETIGLPSQRSDAVLMTGVGDALHLAKGNYGEKDIYETAWILGESGMKGWQKTTPAVTLTVNDGQGLIGLFDGSITPEYFVGTGIGDESEAQAVKVYIMDNTEFGTLDLEIVNELGQVVASGARIQVSDVFQYKVASFMALPGVKYSARVISGEILDDGETAIYWILASTALPEHRSTKWHTLTGGFDIDAGRVFVTAADGLHVYRIMDDGTLDDTGADGKPMFVSMQYPQDVVADWPYAYVSDLERGLMVIDATRIGKQDNEIVGIMDLGHRPCYGIEKYGDKVYLAMGWMGIDIVNIEDPANPDMFSNRFLGDFAYRINGYGSKLMVSTLMNGVELFNIRRLGRLRYLSSYPVDGIPLDTRGHGGLMYVYDLGSDMEIVSLGDLRKPEKVREYSGLNVPVDAMLWGHTSVVHIDGFGIASFLLVDDLESVSELTEGQRDSLDNEDMMDQLESMTQ